MKKIDNERKEFLDRENFSSQEEMVSLNETIDQEFFVEQLEARLETDPLMAGGLFDLFSETQLKPNNAQELDWWWCIGKMCGENSCFINL